MAGKVYDGTTTAPVSTTGTAAGLVSGESLTVTPTAAYNTAAAGTGRTATVSFGLTDGTGLAANYTLANVSRTSLTITPKPINLSGLIAAGKVYDGTPSAAVAVVSSVSQWGSLSGLVSGDSVSLVTSSHSASYDNRNAGTGKTVTFSGLSLGGTAAGKTYDAGTTATVTASGAAGWISGDTVTVSATGLFDTKNVGTGKTVSLSSSYSGTDASNYTITGQATTTANITAKTITVSGITAAGKTYDAGTTATVTTSGAAGWIAGDAVTVSATGLFDTKNEGTGKTVKLSRS